MKHVIDPSPEDQKIIDEYLDTMSTWSPDELVKRYQREYKLGMVGVRRQVLFMIALSHAFDRAFGYSPITLEDGMIVGIGPLRKKQP